MRLRFFIALIVMALLVSYTPGAPSPSLSAASDIRIFVNETQYNLQPQPILHNKRVMVPIRAIGELLGVKASWEAATRSVKVVNEDVTFTLRLDTNRVVKQEPGNIRTSLMLDVPPLLQDGRTYVPLRFISEEIGVSLRWSSDGIGGGTVRLNLPGYTVPVQPAGAAEAFSLRLGGQAEQITALLGKPDRIDPSIYNFEWHVYNKDYARFIMVGIDAKGIVRAIYSQSRELALDGGAVRPGARLPAGTTADRDHTATYNGARLYLDSAESNRIYAILLIDPASAGSAKALTQRNLRSANELQNWDVTNAFRVSVGLAPLLYDDSAASTGRLHSEDMARQNYFAHESLDGRTPWDRHRDNRGALTAIGENLAAGYPSGIEAFHGLVNSPGHRTNIVNPTATHLGVGIAYNSDSDYRTYYTQLFTVKQR